MPIAGAEICVTVFFAPLAGIIGQTVRAFGQGGIWIRTDGAVGADELGFAGGAVRKALIGIYTELTVVAREIAEAMGAVGQAHMAIRA
tara:strand:- start:2205 stop:2468 length:264 start_codon:yes stop_codon:yes gene_type:complete